MNIVKEIQVTKIVIDESKIKVGDKVLYKHREFYNEENKDFWEYKTNCIVYDISKDSISLEDIDYIGYIYDITADDLSEGMYCSIEIIK